jgi:hypothetical protein
LIYAGYSYLWDGSVASIYEKKGDQVLGSVVMLTKEGLSKLDKYEVGYKREKVIVSVNNVDMSVYTYIKQDIYTSSTPSNEYINCINKLLDESGHNTSIKTIQVVNSKDKLVVLSLE